ncbi:uncharacterized protein LOC117641997 [Thrips palmi]|uniref:NADH dehydrogenase [ubiquinone] 1 alpha subcomplex subunit 11 n=1 Tax=Thrips palmi TaxID=161013 RepID=A0A6P8YNH1_THRPL|nr:uncharacterized protein LOC117641997 [Thrips palmi]
MPPRSFGWFDSPDGEDILQKINLASKVGFVAGMPLAIYDHCMNRQATLKGYAFRASACILPCVGAGAAFALTTQSLCKKFPKTNPEWWYMVGGVASASVIGGAVKSVKVGAVLSFYFAISGALARNLCDGKLPAIMFGTLPQQLNNDDELLQQDYRIDPQPMWNMPLPMARPARPHSDLGFY